MTNSLSLNSALVLVCRGFMLPAFDITWRPNAGQMLKSSSRNAGANNANARRSAARTVKPPRTGSPRWRQTIKPRRLPSRRRANPTGPQPAAMRSDRHFLPKFVSAVHRRRCRGLLRLSQVLGTPRQSTSNLPVTYWSNELFIKRAGLAKGWYEQTFTLPNTSPSWNQLT